MVDDDQSSMQGIVALLGDYGNQARAYTSPKLALSVCDKHPGIFVLVDRDLGDQDYGPTGFSGTLCAQLKEKGLRFGRLSGETNKIPQDLQGELLHCKWELGTPMKSLSLCRLIFTWQRRAN